MITDLQIAKVIKELGVTPSLKGYHYLKSAVKKMINDSTYMDGITKRLYPEIAKQFNTTASRVERAMRHAVESGWSKGNAKFQLELFGYSVDANRGNPTNSEFICTIADWFNMQPIKLKAKVK